MADLTQFSDPVVAAIYEQYAKVGNAELSRTYLGASAIGNECQRALWYGFRWARREIFDGRMLRLFQTGHLSEPRFVKDLRDIGATVWEHDPQTGKQFGSVDHSGHMRGHCDGVGQGIPGGGNKPHLLEFKTHEDKSFTSLKKDGLQKAKPVHYAQMIWYMGKMDLDRGLYLAVNKNTDELYSERVTFDPVVFAQLQAKAESIIYAQSPPPKVNTDPKYYLCGWCTFNGICHTGEVPDVTCRSCVHATPEREGDGRWSCAKWGQDVPGDFQRQGCDQHLHLPFLLTYAAPVDAGDGWIEYRRNDNGKEFFVTAVGTMAPRPVIPIYSSQEIAAVKDHRAICDPMVEDLKTQWPGSSLKG